MDARKTNRIIEKIDGKISIGFKPDLSPELEKYRQESLKGYNERYKYTSLRLWAKYKFEKKEEHKKKDYLKYENDPSLVIQETQNIIKQLENIPGDSHFPFFSKQIISFTEYDPQNEKNEFHLLNQSIPLYTCSVLIRDYLDKLNEKQKNFCKKIIMDSVCYLVKNNNHYQSIEGKDIAIQGLSFLFNFISKRKTTNKRIIIFTSY